MECNGIDCDKYPDCKCKTCSNNMDGDACVDTGCAGCGGKKIDVILIN